MPNPVAAQAAAHLDSLQDALQSLGLLTRLLTPEDQLPRLRVINPKATTLSEIISAAPQDERWLFWWSWNEPITEVAHIATAAERIGRVLAATSPNAV